MRCPYCGGGESQVVDSREVGEGIRRRRECLGCGARFTTQERAVARSLYVIKRDGRREPFQREKLLTGVRKACEKRPLPTGTLEKMVDDIEGELYRLGKEEIPSPALGDIVMDRLKKLDHIAYIRFASVYRRFTDLSDLKQEVDSLVGAPVPTQLPLLPGPPPRQRKRAR